MVKVRKGWERAERNAWMQGEKKLFQIEGCNGSLVSSVPVAVNVGGAVHPNLRTEKKKQKEMGLTASGSLLIPRRSIFLGSSAKYTQR